MTQRKAVGWALAALTVAGLTLVPAAQAEAGTVTASGATLSVNDPTATGTPGTTSLLSLQQAIELTNGTLSVSSLSPAQRGQVRGTPGAGRTDRITLTVPTIVVPAAGQLPPLDDNAHDILDGNAATLKASEAKGTGLVVSSSYFRLTNLTIEGFDTDLGIDPAGRSLRDVSVDHVHLRPVEGVTLAVGSTRSNGRLDGLSITDSSFYAGPPSEVPNSAPSVIAAAAAYATSGQTVNNTLLENVVFTRNDVSGGFEGFYLWGGVTANGGTVDDAHTRNVKVFDNYFHDIGDESFGAEGGEAGGHVTKSGIDGLIVSHNRVDQLAWGIGLFGGESFMAGAVERSHVRDVLISNNTITQNPSERVQGWCVIIEGGRPTFPPGSDSEDTISNVRITGNKMSGCKTAGVAIHGGVPLFDGTSATRNVVSDVLLDHNTIQDAGDGIALRGGYDNGGPGGVSTDNRVSDIRIFRNTLIDNTTQLRLVGAETAGLGTATRNVLRDISFRANTIRGGGPCVAMDNLGTGASGNTADVTCPS